MRTCHCIVNFLIYLKAETGSEYPGTSTQLGTQFLKWVMMQITNGRSNMAKLQLDDRRTQKRHDTLRDTPLERNDKRPITKNTVHNNENWIIRRNVKLQ